MSRPLQRGVLGGGRLSGNIQDYLEDSQMKIKNNKEDFDKNVTSTLRNPFQFLFSENSSSKQDTIENGFIVSDSTLRNRHMLTLLFLKISLVIIVILGLTMSLLFTVSLTKVSKGNTVRGFRRLQEQLVSDLWDIGEISLGSSRFKVSEFCSLESENYVPCFNISQNLEAGLTEGKEFDRRCGPMSKQNCLILAPMRYKIPHRWPTGRDVIWIDNVKITAQEVLSSGSLTKRSVNRLFVCLFFICFFFQKKKKKQLFV